MTESTICVTEVRFGPPQFTGKERDTESGLDYFGARYYASSMGRWMSPDWAAKPEAVPYSKLDDPQSLNLYGYVRNNPLSKADKDGHEVPGLPDSSIQKVGQDAATLGALITQFAHDHPVLTQLGIQVGLAIITKGEGDSVSMPKLTEGGALPDSAPVVRGGLPQNIPNGTGVTTDANGNLQGVSVNSAAGKTVEQLSQGLPQNKVGTTTVGEVRSAGGDVKPSPTLNNPDHCTMCGITPQKAQEILKVIPNPAKTQ
jgi:RHS repeat-associated protein